MFRKLVKTDALTIEDQTFPVRYFELRTQRGTRRYSAEILLGPDDRIILDDDSVTDLEARTACLVPATLYSRMLVTAATANRVVAAAAPDDYLRGRTGSLSCLAIRAFTTVFAGILIASPVAGFRPMRAFRF